MSGVYWSIVVGLVAMVATLLVCLEVSYTEQKGSSKALGDGIDESSEAATPASGGHRHAA